MQTDLITKVYFNEHLTHSCVGMPKGLQALLSSYYQFTHVHSLVLYYSTEYPYLAIITMSKPYLFLFGHI